MQICHLDQVSLTIDLNPCNLNLGIPGLTERARSYGIDLTQCKDALIFVSRNHKLLKMVWYDHAGSSMITRKLAKGGFQRLVTSIYANGLKSLTFAELCLYLDGERIQV